jgi:riboflavin synthase
VFTGIVEAVGTIARVEEASRTRRLRVEAPGIAATLAAGDSIAVDGVCLTVESTDGNAFTATAVAETLARTTLRDRAPGDAVNLERAAGADRLFGGHLVQGHVDSVAQVVSFDAADAASTLVLELPENVFELCVDQGSIAVDGVSLTIASRTAPGRITIAIVPHTLGHTTFASYAPGRRVNVEADVIAKYVRAFLRRDGQRVNAS